MKNKQLHTCRSCLLALITLYLAAMQQLAYCFEFKAPDIVVSPATISSSASYQITFLRQFAADGFTITPYATQAVPSGSTISVTFPTQFTLTGAQTCTFLMIDTALVGTFTTSVNITSRTITISGAITSSKYIANVFFELSGVTNPSPALTTDSITGKIGTDTSASGNSGKVTLEPGDLTSVTAVFSPSTVNTTSSLLVTLVNAHAIPSGGKISVKFPDTLRWTRQITQAHTLPLTTTMSCSGTQNIYFTITCSGSTTTQIVTLQNIFNTSIAAGTTISFTINSLFSPPTTQPNLDSLLVSTIDASTGTDYYIDQLTTYISGLTPKTTTLTISSGNNLTVNTGVALNLMFPLVDTISKNDYLVITFPTGTQITYQTRFSSQLNLTNGSYSSTTNQLTFNQSTSSPNVASSTVVSLTFLTYVVPGSSRTTDPIVLSIRNNGYAKMTAQATITPVANSYTGTVSTLNTRINAQTTYTINFTLVDGMSATGYLQVILPDELFLSSSVTVSLSGTSIASTPTSHIISQSSLNITQMNISSSAIPAQNISLSITGILQPASVQTLSNFTVNIFYSQEYDDLVAIMTAVTSNTVTITPGQIVNTVGISASSDITANQNVSYTFTIPLPDDLEVGSKVVIAVPEEIQITATSGLSLCQIQSVAMASSSCIVDLLNNTLTFVLSSGAYTSGTLLQLKYLAFINAFTTAPTSQPFDLSIYNSKDELVNILSSAVLNTLYFSVSTPSQLLSTVLTRSSRQNNAANTYYTFTFTQVQPIQQTSAVLVIQLPTEISVVEANLSCSDVSTGTAVNLNSCTYSSTDQNSIFVTFPSSNTVHSYNKVYIIRVGGLTNPYSLAPTTSSIILYTRVSPATASAYAYSRITTGLVVTNDVPSTYTSSQLSFQFTNRVLSDYTALILQFETDGQNIPEGASVGYYYILFAPSFQVDSQSTLACSSSQPSLVLICTLLQNSTNSYYQLKVEAGSQFPSQSATNNNNTTSQSFTIQIQTLETPSSIPTDFTTITSYDANGYKISVSNNLVQFSTYCTFPCRQCNDNISLTTCTACYDTAITTRIYLHNSSCLTACPSQYYQDTVELTCKACLAPCYQCQSANNYCTYCDLNSTYIYLNVTIEPSQNINRSTCVSSCPALMYADTTQIPNKCVACVSPCLRCTAQQTCTTCITSYYFYASDSKCYAACPLDITVTVGDQCIACAAECATCSIVPSNCTSCAAEAALYNGACVFTCPGFLIIYNQLCVQCDVQCRTCQAETSNCTSCFTTNTSLFQYYYQEQNQCLSVCPNFYYPDTFKQCQACADENRGCRNCSSPTVCLSCDSGYVLLNNNCLNSTPEGYLNISGVAVACGGDCQTCSVTLTNCTSCKVNNLFGTTCLAACPSGYIPVDQICLQCVYPCETCVDNVNKCTACDDNSSLFLSEIQNECVDAAECPQFTYASSVTHTCEDCVSPCLQCDTLLQCVSCVEGLYLLSVASTTNGTTTATTNRCVDDCPVGMAAVDSSLTCQQCSYPCQQCSSRVDKCLTCASGHFYNDNTNQCLMSCPSGLIQNYTLMECVACESPCKTCENTTQTCLSCVSGWFLSGNQCVQVCPEGQYGDSGLCKDCVNNCSTCTTAVKCLSCQYPLVLYSQQCIDQCPVTHSIVSNDSVCISCQTVQTGCSNCSQNGQCYQCYSPRIYHNGQCLTKCPSGYQLIDFSCEEKNITDTVLEETLEDSEVFPLPFTILGGVFFIACCMSKLSNFHTYLIGAVYSFLGLVETASIIYLLYRYYSIGQENYQPIYIYLLLGALGVIYLLNVLAFFIQSMLLLYDRQFEQWLRGCAHKSVYTFVVVASLLVNYKFKMLLFTRLFKFSSLSARLENVSKFRMFNIYSFFGLIAEGLALFVSFLLIFDYLKVLALFYAFLDVIIICLINVVLAILIAWKKDQFFQQEDGEYTLHKKIIIEGDDYSKEAIEVGLGEGDVISVAGGGQSYTAIKAGIIQEDQEEYSSHYTGEEVQQQQQSKVSKPGEEGVQKSKLKIYFANQDESSNPLRRQPTARRKQVQQDVTPNIFSNMSIEKEDDDDNEESKGHRSQIVAAGEDLEGSSQDFDISSGGGSEKILAAMPIKVVNSARNEKKEVIYAVDSKAISNLATQNDDIKKQISARQNELDEIKKEMDEKEKLRKQKLKLKKKNVKSIQTIEVPIRSPKKSKPEEIDQEQKHQTYEKEIQLDQEPQQQSEKEKQQIQQNSNKIDQNERQPSYQELTIRDSSQKDRTQEDTLEVKGKQIANIFMDEEERQEQIGDQEINFPKKTIGSWMELRVNDKNKDQPLFASGNEYRTMSAGLDSLDREQGEGKNTITARDSQASPKKHRQHSQQNQKTYKSPQKHHPNISPQKDEKLEKEEKLNSINFEIQAYKNASSAQKNSKQTQKQLRRPSPQTKSKKDQADDAENNEKNNSGNFDDRGAIKWARRDQPKIRKHNFQNLAQNRLEQYQRDENLNENQRQDDLNIEIQNHQDQQIAVRDQNIPSGQSGKTKQIKKIKFDFQDEMDRDFDERGNTKMNFYHDKADESGLEDSQHEDQRINQRPLSGVKRQGLNTNQALLDILEKAEKDRLRIRQSLSKHKRVPDEDSESTYRKNTQQQSRGFKYSGPHINEEAKQLEQDEARKSKIYWAGVQQVDRDSLQKKHSLNHPLKSLRKQSQQDSEMDSSIGGVNLNKSRNKSFNTGSGLKKFTSKDISMEQLEDIEFNKVSIKDDYSQLMNERVGNNENDRYDGTEMRIGSSSTARVNRLPRPFSQNPTGTQQSFRRGNFIKQGQQISFTHEDDELKEYYQKQAHNSRGKSKNKSKNKKKDLSREKSVEDSRRLKHLQKIYLASPHK